LFKAQRQGVGFRKHKDKNDSLLDSVYTSIYIHKAHTTIHTHTHIYIYAYIQYIPYSLSI